MTFSMIPIAVGAMLLGPLAGTILGGVYGLTSLYNAITGTGGMTFMLFGISPILTILLCVGTRILVGAVTGWIFRGLKKLDEFDIWCYFAGGLAAPLLNTIFFMGFLVLAFYNTDYIQQMAAGKGATNPLNFIILVVGVQGLIEAATGLVIGGTVAKGVARALNIHNTKPSSVNKPSEGISIAALVCGIIGIIGGSFDTIRYFALVIAIVGILLGATGLKRAKVNNKPKGLAIAGLVLGIVGAAFCLIWIIYTAVLVTTLSNLIS